MKVIEWLKAEDTSKDSASEMNGEIVKWRKWEDDPEYGSYLVAILQKYDWEKEWEKIIEPAFYDVDGWTFETDWNEGQSYKYVGMVNTDDIPFPNVMEN